MKIFEKPMHAKGAGEVFFYQMKSSISSAAVATHWLAPRYIQVLKHSFYWLDLTTIDYFLSPNVKKELADLTLTKETFKKEWGGGTKTLSAADAAEAFLQ